MFSICNFEHELVYLNANSELSQPPNTCLNSERWEEGKKTLPTSFSPVTSTKVEISSQNFLTFSFNPFAILVQNF